MRRGRAALLLAALLLSLLGSAARADTLARELLDALHRSETLELRGTAHVEVLFPPRDRPRVAAAVLPRPPWQADLLARNFAVQRREGTLLGQPAVLYLLTPLNPQAPSWRVWVDPGTGLPLGYEERSAGGALARRAALQAFTPSPTPAASSRATPAASSRATPAVAMPDRAALAAAVQAALPGLRLPAGFVPVALRAAPGALDIECSDGLNVLLLSLRGRAVHPAPGVASRRVPGGHVWAVGNLPPAALRTALSGLTQVNAAPLRALLQSER